MRGTLENDHVTRHQFQRIAAKTRAPHQLKEGSAENKREVRRLRQGRCCGIGLYGFGWSAGVRPWNSLTTSATVIRLPK